MKTVTEFTGLEIKRILKLQADIIKKFDENPPKEVVAEAAPEAEEVPTEAPVEETQVKSEETPAAADDVAVKAEEKAEPAAETDVKAADTQSTDAKAGLPKKVTWKDKAVATKPQLIEQMKEQFSWKNEDRFGMAADACSAVNPRLQDKLRKVTALKKDKEDEKLPQSAQEIGDLVYIADYIVIKKERNDKDDHKNKNGRHGGKGKKPFPKDKDGKPAKRIRKPIPNPVKSNNKTVTVEKK